MINNINCYLRTLVCILAFFCVVLIFIKNRKSTFVVPDVFKTKKVSFPKLEQVHYLDSRYKYPYDPPVNPITMLSEVVTDIKPNSDLYTPFTNFYEINDSENSIITPENNTNELNYSGGKNVLLKVPLQMNYPNEYEQLRSQNILITPYNKNKYSNNCN
jgi:hypothetical protein